MAVSYISRLYARGCCGDHTDSWVVPTDCNYVLYILGGYNWTTGDINSLTIGGVSATDIGWTTYGTSHVDIWGQLNPLTGTQNFVVDHDAAHHVRTAIFFKGVDSANPVVDTEFVNASVTTTLLRHTFANTFSGNMLVGGWNVRDEYTDGRWSPDNGSQVEILDVWNNSGIGSERNCTSICYKPAPGGSTTFGSTCNDVSGSNYKTSFAVELNASRGGGQVIWSLSKIYDRIQENRKKLGIGDLGNFGKGFDGLWKPNSGLVTI